MLEPYQARAVAELGELNEKLARLASFVGSNVFNNLDMEERSLIYRQVQLMRAYSHVLGLRIAAFR